MTVSPPSLAGLQDFIANMMGIPTSALPLDAPVISDSYDYSISVTNALLQSVVPGPLYALAVYNLAGDYIVNYAIDQNGQVYFAELRKTLNINAPYPGVVQAASDEGSSVSMMVPKFYDDLTLNDMQLLRTPWGRNYLAIAQRVGPSAWGVT
jgi:hypothetical protein